jgi:hypothetical protein
MILQNRGYLEERCPAYVDPLFASAHIHPPRISRRTPSDTRRKMPLTSSRAHPPSVKK